MKKRQKIESSIVERVRNKIVNSLLKLPYIPPRKDEDKRKKCSMCGKTRYIKYFARDSHNKTGYRSECKICHAKMQRRKYLKQKERREHGNKEGGDCHNVKNKK